ncbi:MAG: hypothetical protein AAFP90_20360, partial [Planctomycetota bacterium]
MASVPNPKRQQENAHSEALWQPFAHLNLRRNPFGEITHEERGLLAIVDPVPLLQFLADDQTTPVAIQIIADCGRGKSSTIHALHACLQRRRPVPQAVTDLLDAPRFQTWQHAAYYYIPQDGPHPRIDRTEGVPLLIDE